MITRVILRGFQSHVDTDIELDSGLNVVTGQTDSGKTAIIRAIRWVAFNDPQGEAFLNTAVGETEVVIHKADGQIITKRRKGGKTSYSLQCPGLPEMNFNKAELPEEIKVALGIEKQRFGDYEAALNFAFQLDAPFLISEAASAGAKVLGKLAGTEVVDMAIKSVAKDNYRHQQERSALHRAIEKLEIELQAYDDLEELKSALQAVEYLLARADKANNRYTTLSEVRAKYEAANVAIAKYAEILDKLAIVPSLEEDMVRIEKAQQRYDTLLRLFDKLNRLSETLAGIIQEKNRYQGIDAVNELLQLVEGNYHKLVQLLNLSASYTGHEREMSRLSGVIAKTDNLDVAASILQQATDNRQKLSALVFLAAEHTRLKQQRSRLAAVVADTESMVEAASLLQSVEKRNRRLSQLLDIKRVYDVKQQTAVRVAAEVRKADADYKTYQDALSELWAGLDVCPLCERPMKGGK